MAGNKRRQLRLVGFFSVPGNHLAGWRHPDAVPTADMDFKEYAHITQVAEEAKFDTIFFQDTVGVAGSRALARGERTRAELSRTVKLEPTATLAAPPLRARRGGPVEAGGVRRVSGATHTTHRPTKPPLPLHVHRPTRGRPRRLEPGDLAD